MLNSMSLTEEVVMSRPRMGLDFAVNSTLVPFLDQTLR